MILVIDNYDSFTYNLVHYCQELGADVVVKRNDAISLDEIRSLQPAGILISPGPGTPNDAGISLDVIRQLGQDIPILGVCLGHQSIGQVFGGEVVRAATIMHGKTSLIYHTNEGVFAGLPNPYTATRYHSLVIRKTSVPSTLKITAWTQNAAGEMDEIMGVQHHDLPIHGVQFHPESILTEHGHALLQNFLQRVAQ